MLTLTDVVSDYVRREAPHLNETYKWGIPSSIPWCPDFKIGTDTLHVANLRLRHSLQEQWTKLKSAESRLDLATWYVSRWGGVKRNAKGTIQRYVEEECAAVAGSGTKGIPSWSKILVLRESKKYLIFDARVSASLNALQLLHCQRVKLFPLLSSRNGVIKEFNSSLRQRMHEFESIPSQKFYERYLSICGETRRNRGTAEEVEMTLFANAEELSRAALPKI